MASFLELQFTSKGQEFNQFTEDSKVCLKADCHRPSSHGQVYTDTEALSPDTRTIIRSINVNFTEILHVNCRGYFAVNDQAEILDLPRKYTADNAARPSTKHTSGLPALHYLSTYCFWDLPNSTSNCILSTGELFTITDGLYMEPLHFTPEWSCP